MLEIFAVPVEGADDGGVVIIRVGAVPACSPPCYEDFGVPDPAGRPV